MAAKKTGFIPFLDAARGFKSRWIGDDPSGNVLLSLLPGEKSLPQVLQDTSQSLSETMRVLDDVLHAGLVERTGPDGYSLTEAGRRVAAVLSERAAS